MRRLVLRLLQPTPTSPFNPFYGQSDNRSAPQQVVSGLRLAGGLVGGFLILGLAFWSISSLVANATPSDRTGHLVSWSMLCFSAVTMFLTVNRWVAFVPAYCCFILVRVLGLLIFGLASTSSTASDWTSRRDLLELIAVSA